MGRFEPAQNIFLADIDRQYRNEFGKEGAKIGTTLRIRLPNDFSVLDSPPLIEAEPKTVRANLTATEVAAIGAAVVIAKNPIISRRFWSR